MSRKPRFEALVVNAIRRLQAAQGSTASEIASYLSQEYDVSGPEVRRQIQTTIRRGVNYGILQKSKRGYVTCDRTVPEALQEPIDITDCYSCKRSLMHSRAGHGRRRGRSSRRRAGGHMSRKSKGGRRRKASRGAGRFRAGRRRGQSVQRRTRGPVTTRQRSPRKQQLGSEKKSKKIPAGEDPNSTRQANHRRSNSKSPMRTGGNEESQGS